MRLNTEDIKEYRESAIYALANGAGIQMVIEAMEQSANNDKFEAAEGMRQAIYDWNQCSNRLNCRSIPTSDGERVQIDFSVDLED